MELERLFRKCPPKISPASATNDWIPIKYTASQSKCHGWMKVGEGLSLSKKKNSLHFSFLHSRRVMGVGPNTIGSGFDFGHGIVNSDSTMQSSRTSAKLPHQKILSGSTIKIVVYRGFLSYFIQEKYLGVCIDIRTPTAIYPACYGFQAGIPHIFFFFFSLITKLQSSLNVLFSVRRRLF